MESLSFELKITKSAKSNRRSSAPQYVHFRVFVAQLSRLEAFEDPLVMIARTGEKYLCLAKQHNALKS